MDIDVVIAAVIAKQAGWEQLLADSWDCIYKNYPSKLALLELLSSEGLGIAPNFSNPLINGAPIGQTYAAYGTGTNYTLTNTQAAVTFGTSSPNLVLAQPGTYRLSGCLHLDRIGATVVAETVSFKIRRTNNTAADLSAIPVVDLPVSATLTDTLGFYQIPTVNYTTASSDDALSLFAAISAGLGAGTIQAVGIGTFLYAERLK